MSDRELKVTQKAIQRIKEKYNISNDDLMELAYCAVALDKKNKKD